MNSTVLLSVLLSVIIIFVERKEPGIEWAWLLLLNTFPVLGFLLYLTVGMNSYKEKMFRANAVEKELRKIASKQEKLIASKSRIFKNEEMNRYQDMMYYNLETADAIVTDNNFIDIIIDGKCKFEQLKQDIKNAKHYIHLQYYIIQKDELWDEIAQCLIEKARENIDVRVLCDGMGSRKLGRKKLIYLEENGIKVAEFFPALFGKFHLRINYRNHRKIVVIDGAVGYVGGFNIGREYLGKEKRFGYWRDTHLRIEGAATTSLAMRFTLDWNYATGGNMFRNDASFIVPTYREKGETAVQIISSGPDTKYQQIRDNYLMMINNAKKNIYIQTPYFVPDDAILTALKIAAISGIDVKIIIPDKPDHPMVYWATYSYIGELIESGVKCYTYANGFLHAKVITVDGMVCSCGTANMDIRSFKLNFEVGAIVYDTQFTEKMESHIRTDLLVCKQVTTEVYKMRGIWVKYKEGFARLFSPVL